MTALSSEKETICGEPRLQQDRINLKWIKKKLKFEAEVQSGISSSTAQDEKHNEKSM